MIEYAFAGVAGVMGVPWDDFRAPKELLEGKVAGNIAQNGGSVGRVRRQDREWVKLLPAPV